MNRSFRTLFWTLFGFRLVRHLQVGHKGVVECLREGGVVIRVGGEGDGRSGDERLNNRGAAKVGGGGGGGEQVGGGGGRLDHNVLQTQFDGRNLEYA